MSQSCNTHSSSKKAPGIGNNYLNITNPTIAIPGSSSLSPLSPSIRSVQLSADNQPDDDGNPPPENFPLPEINDPDADSDLDHEPNPVEPAPQLLDQVLARTLELLANNIALIP